MVAGGLRRSERPVLLAVNKADNESRDLEIHQFHTLGLGEPMAVSGISGRGTGDLLDALVNALSNDVGADSGVGDADEALLKIAVLGRPNVGKSSFVNAVCGAERVIVSPSAGTTRDSADIEVTFDDHSLVLIDTAGLRRRTRVKESVEYYSALRALQSLDRCDVALVLLDAQDGSTHQDARILERVLERGKGAVLVVNKWDLIEKETGTAEGYERDLRDFFRFAGFVPVVFISALTGQRLNRCLQLAVESGESRRRELQTSHFNTFVKEMLAGNEAITPAMGDVRIYYALQAGIEPPTFLFFVNSPKKVKPNFKRFLERRIRETFSLEGTPLRLRFRARA
jgi:GTP-binding protein